MHTISLKTNNFSLLPPKRFIFPTDTFSNRPGDVEASCRCYGQSEGGDKESHIFTSKNLNLNVVTKLLSVLIVYIPCSFVEISILNFSNWIDGTKLKAAFFRYQKVYSFLLLNHRRLSFSSHPTTGWILNERGSHTYMNTYESFKSYISTFVTVRRIKF